MNQGETVSAAERAWNSAIQAEVARGLTPEAAARKLNREQPDMVAAYEAAYNERSRGQRASTGPEPATITALKAACPGASASEILAFHESGTPTAVASFETAVNQYMKQGMTKAAATREVAVKSPGVYTAYEEAFTRQSEKKRANYAGRFGR